MFAIAIRRIRIAATVGRLLPLYLLLGLLKNLVPVQELARWTWRHPIGRRNRQYEQRLLASIAKLNKLLGARGDCLQRSLLLYGLMSRARADPTLFIGYNLTKGRFLGHAWVTIDGRPVIDSEADLLQYTPILRFGARGTRLQVQPLEGQRKRC